MSSSEKPFRLGRALLLSLAAGLLATLAVAFWPRSDGQRLSGIYLMAGGTGLLQIEPGLGSYSVRTSSPLPHLNASAITWKAVGGSRNLRIEGNGGPASRSPGHDAILILDLTPSPDRPGDWDLLLVRNEQRRSNRFLALLEQLYRSFTTVPPAPVAGPVPSFLHRVDDPLVVQYFDIVSKERDHVPLIGHDSVPATATVGQLAPPGPRGAELVSLARVLVARHPEDLHVRILLLDALIRAREEAELERLVEEWRPDYTRVAESAPMLHAVFREAERQARGLTLSREGRNGWETLVRALSPSTGLETCLALLGTLFPAEDLIRPWPLTGRDDRVVNYLSIQNGARLAWTETSLRLLQGRPDEARALALSLYRLGQLVEEHDSFLITRLIGIANRYMGTRALEMVALNGCRTTSEVLALGRALEALAARERETDQVAFLDGGFIPLPLSFSVSADLSGARIRHQGASARFRLVRTALAVRGRLLADGRWPDPAEDDALAPFLPGGIPRDPFSPTSAPLSLIHDPVSDTMTVFSVGPDGRDDGGAVEYDPTNGVVSPGDLTVQIPREPRYPFPAEGVRAATAAELEGLFPHGLPPDPFAKTMGRALGVAQTSGGLVIYSVGPDRDDTDAERAGVNYQPESPYDPTNGTVSRGDLYIRVPGQGHGGGEREAGGMF